MRFYPQCTTQKRMAAIGAKMTASNFTVIQLPTFVFNSNRVLTEAHFQQ